MLHITYVLCIRRFLKRWRSLNIVQFDVETFHQLFVGTIKFIKVFLIFCCLMMIQTNNVNKQESLRLGNFKMENVEIMKRLVCFDERNDLFNGEVLSM